MKKTCANCAELIQNHCQRFKYYFSDKVAKESVCEFWAKKEGSE